jgi:hypothetical protein
MESDWKKFSAMVPVLRERYLAQRNRAIAAILNDPARNETKRFWDTMEQMEKEAKVLQRCLDGHSRSNLWQYMATMIQAGMMTKEDLAQFSDGLQQGMGAAFDRK